MTRTRRPGFGGALPFNRVTAIAMILAATLPVALLGGLVYARVEQALALDAVVRTERAVDAATAELDRVARDLDELVRSYAGWSVVAQQVEAGELDALRTGVVDYLVERGTVAGGIVAADGQVVVAGPPALQAALREEVGRYVPSPRLLTVDGQVFLVDDDPIAGAGGTTVGRIALARKLDARMAATIADFTGFAVAVIAADGTVAVTTDASVTGPGTAAAADGGQVVRAGDVIGRRAPLGLAGSGEQLVVATRVSALQATAGTLPILVLGLLGITAVLAALFAVLLSAVLGRRLRVIHDGLTAVADGRVPPVPAAGGEGDDIGRLSQGLDRLVHTLDRREAILRRCLEATASIPINTGGREAAARLATATVEIFGVAWCRLAAADGSMLGSAGPVPAAPAPTSGGEVAAAHMGIGLDDRLLEVGVLPGAPWTDADQALLEVMAVLAGSVLDEVEAYGRAVGRADRLDRLNRLQREFLRSISHNLRTPLATIELAATDLEELAGSPFVVERAQAIRVEERRLARLVNQVLLLSRMEAGTLELDGEPVALVPLARRMAAELGLGDRVRILDRGGGSVAFADPAAVEQIAWILLDNAARYAPNGVIHVEIVADRPEPEPTVVLAVEDEGPGVAPDERRRIFQRFVRGRAGAGTDGTGLGLSVARGLARTLGGDVTCRPGAVGARFEVRLPSGGGDPDATDARPEADPAVSKPAAGPSPAGRPTPAGTLHGAPSPG